MDFELLERMHSLETDFDSVFRDGKHGKNFLGLSDKIWGIILLLLGSIFNAIDSIMLQIAGDNGFSSNALTIYASVFGLFGALVIDLIYYFCIGYYNGTIKVYCCTILFIFCLHCSICRVCVRKAIMLFVFPF